MKKIIADNVVHLCLFAFCDIVSGDEVRYDYGPDDGDMDWRYSVSDVFVRLHRVHTIRCCVACCYRCRCSSKIQNGLSFWYRLARVVLDRGP